MRRSSNAILQSQTSEPLIVVEDSNCDEKTALRYDAPESDSRQHSSEDESPTAMNPYLLSPYSREIRKHSLPTPQCSGITASQVRRLSERGETAGPGPRQAEFLATLSTAPAPSAGGRRHSVVTISKVPPALFGRNRRESVAAYPSGPLRVLPNRRESIAWCPPSTEPRGSVHNLQLDIMDDIVQARKVRMKLWNTSNEKVCEVQPLDEGSVQRYTESNRRYSDFVGTTLAPIPSSSGKHQRRASELPPPPNPTTTASKTLITPITTTGIVCSNTDLISILSSLSTSSTEIDQCERGRVAEERRRGRLKDTRSNSFDVSILQAAPPPSDWFARRHRPIRAAGEPAVVEKEPAKVVWDERSMVDAHALGSAIEGFLRHSTSSASTSPKSKAAGRSKGGWFSSPGGGGGNKGDEGATDNTCDSSSICSTLKDLFVK